MTNFYCAAPWRGLHINPRGDVKTCCAGNPNMLGNLNTQTIEQILNSSLMAKIRTSLAKGEPHDYCSNCVRAERFGADSERQWHNNVNPDFDYAIAGDQYHYPVIVDVRWNTTCNLSCNYCGELCSSKWAQLKQVPFRSGARPYYEQVCDFLEQHHDHIHEVALVGGEPLLLPENERLLDVIPESAIVTLITNLTVDLQNNKIFRRLAERNRVGWSMSFDNIGEQFEYVRYGGSWAVLQENLKVIKELMRTQGHWGGVHAVYNIYNATRLCEFRQFVEDTNNTVLWQNLFQPEYLDPFLHGPAVAELAAAEIEQFYALDIATPAEQQFFDQALSNYRAITHERAGTTQKFRQHIQDIETKYHPNTQGQFARLWPELVGITKEMQ
jgi:MoaA/NifB/PqqE/SkfB family radical SAM enzyme